MSTAGDSVIYERISRPAIKAWSELKYYWYADLYRYSGKTGVKQYLHALLRNTGYQYTFLMRLCTYLSQNKGNIWKKAGFRLFYEIFRLFSIILSVEIAYNTRIGAGLYIPHIIGIVVHQDTVIGKNCHLSQNVTIGQLNRGEKKGSPLIGDNVYIAPGAVVIGNIKIGHNVVIGANSVVNKDIPENAVVGGIPATILSFKGSQDYIVRTDY
jgi:serine O-acetyltransferase